MEVNGVPIGPALEFILNSPPSVLESMSPQEQEALLRQARDEEHQYNIALQQKQQKENKPPSQDEEIGAAFAGPVGTAAGIYAGNELANWMAKPAATAPGAAQTGTQAVAPAAQPAATGATQVPAAASAGQAPAAQIPSSFANAGGTAAELTASGQTLALPAGEAIPAGYQAVGSMADGSTMIAPAAEGVAANASPFATTLGTVGTVAGIAGGAYGAYQLGRNLSDNQKDPAGGAMAGAAVGAGATAAYGAYVGSAVGPVGTVIGAAIGALVGTGIGMIGGNKDKDQLKRDAIRGYLKDQGVLDDTFTLTRPDGGTFNLGLDGDAMLPSVDGTERRAFDADLKDPRTAQIIGQVAPIAAILAGKDQKIRDDFTGYFTNYVLSGGDANANVQALYQRFGLDKASAWQAINDYQSKGAFDEQGGHILRNALNTVFGGGAPAGTTPATAGAPAPQIPGQKPPANPAPRPMAQQGTPPAVAPRPQAATFGGAGQSPTANAISGQQSQPGAQAPNMSGMQLYNANGAQASGSVMGGSPRGPMFGAPQSGGGMIPQSPVLGGSPQGGRPLLAAQGSAPIGGAPANLTPRQGQMQTLPGKLPPGTPAAAVAQMIASGSSSSPQRSQYPQMSQQEQFTPGGEKGRRNQLAAVIASGGKTPYARF